MSDRIRVIKTIPRLGEKASGPSYSIPELARHMALQGTDVKLFSADPPDKKLAFQDNFEHIPSAPSEIMPVMCRAPLMKKALSAAIPSHDIVHSAGMWMMPAHYPAALAVQFQKPLVISPRGSFSENALKRSKWKKKLVWTFLHKNVFKQANAFHATAEKEAQEIRAQGLHQPIAVIPNGIDIPDLEKFAQQKSNVKTALFLGRIHPIKGVDLLLDVWCALDPKARKNWKLRIVGSNPVGERERLEAQVRDLGLDGVEFSGPVFGDQKWQEYANADLYILPTQTENFGITIAEALAMSVPVITTKGTPWKGLIDHQCGWWVERDHEALKNALEDALRSDDLEKIGARGRQWMQRDFAWQDVARKMIEFYGWILGGQKSSVPDFVHLD